MFQIGLMRGGQLLAEQSPDDLIAAYNASTLEEVFLLLSRRQGDGTTPLVQADTPSQVDSAMDVFENQKHKGVGESKETLVLDDFAELPPTTVSRSHFPEPAEYKDLELTVATTGTPPHPPPIPTKKQNNTRSISYRRYSAVPQRVSSSIIIFPILEISAFFLAIGGQPHGLKFAVVNDELGNYSNCGEYLTQNSANLTWLDEDTCRLGGKLSCQFLEAINDTMGVKVYYDDLDTAIYDLRKGRVTAVIYTARNFSQALQTRLELGSSATDDEIVESQVIISVDTTGKNAISSLYKAPEFHRVSPSTILRSPPVTDLQLSQDLKWRLLRLYLEFAENITIACQRPIKLAHIPIDFKDPVYGEKNPSYTIFMAPGVIVSLVYFLSVSLTSTILLVEKMDGIWGRTLVAGVTSSEVLMSHVISQMVQTFIQMVFILLMSLYVFGFEIRYNFTLAVVLIALQAMAGMTFGFLMSSLCDEIRTANYFSLGIFYPYLLTSGIMWPVEAMPTVLRYISYTMPGTLAIESLRNLIMKDWTLLHPQVFGGFLSSIAYIVVQMALCLLVMKYKKL
uniref:ABC transmembrane type-2 domain-containing protein n=1 Tax=Timema cristinae TaxID=61476 RepID=A0A7R9H6E8_TIMCR|nr:unnamed protein product [Timema cristinae]